MSAYGIRSEYDWYTERTTALTVWEGPFYQTWTATAERVRNGAKSTAYRKKSTTSRWGRTETMSDTTVKTVYAETDFGRLGASHVPGEDQVTVWRSGAGHLGRYNLTRLEGGRLTAGTLRKLFTRQEAAA